MVTHEQIALEGPQMSTPFDEPKIEDDLRSEFRSVYGSDKPMLNKASMSRHNKSDLEFAQFT